MTRIKEFLEVNELIETIKSKDIKIENEKKLNAEPKKFLYSDMSINELTNYFKKSRNSIDVAI